MVFITTILFLLDRLR